MIKRREITDEGGDGHPLASIRLTSPYDTDARRAAKRDTFWYGYKIHISETCATPADDAARPALATAAATARWPKPDCVRAQAGEQAGVRVRLADRMRWVTRGGCRRLEVSCPLTSVIKVVD